MDIEDLKTVGIDGPKDGKLIIDVYTVWCGPCKIIAPILHKLRDEGLIQLLQVDLDQNRPLQEIFRINSIPTLLFFKEGKLLEKKIEVGQALVQNGMLVGSWGEAVLREIINQM